MTRLLQQLTLLERKTDDTLLATAAMAALPGWASAQSLQSLYEAARAYDATYLSARKAAEAAQFGVVVKQVPDPMLAGLAIPETAPTMGMWSGLKAWPMNAITLALLPSGKVLSFGTPGGNPGIQDGRTFAVWDPAQGFAGGHVTLAGVVGVNSFCAAQAFRADGSMLIAGGIFDNGNDKGSVVLNNTATGVTAAAAKLANDRYYSTMLTLPNGQQLIMGGSYPYLGGWNDPQGSIDKGYMTGMTPELYDGTRWRSLFGAKSRDAFGPENNRWWYPRAWIAPNGQVFGITSEKMWFLDPTGNGTVRVTNFKEAQRNATSALDAPNVGPVSTAAMYETGKILQVGGNSYDNGTGFLASSRASVIDINGGAPVVTDTAPMSVGRAWANATVLPTGQVVVNGGSKFNDRGGDDVVLHEYVHHFMMQYFPDSYPGWLVEGLAEYYMTIDLQPKRVQIGAPVAAHDASLPATFEATMRQLTEIVGNLEAGDADLEGAIAAYERGIALQRHAEALLAAARLRIEELRPDGTLDELELDDDDAD